jgi:hypothetical protein
MMQPNFATSSVQHWQPCLLLWSSLTMPVMILFCDLKLAAVILSTNMAETGLWFCPQNRAHLAKLNLTVHMPPIDFY